MEKKFKIGVIGGGYMAFSIVKGAIESNSIDKSAFVVNDINEESLKKFSDLGVSVTDDAMFLSNNSEFVLFSVKPQNFSQVANLIRYCSCKKFISIMAGVKKSTIKNYFTEAKVARCMPNAPCAVGSGAVGIDLLDFPSELDKSFIINIFSSFSNVVELSEDKLNVVTGISGSSPAYFYLFAKGLIESGIKNGLSEEQSKNLVINTLIGSGKMLKNNTDKTIDELIDSVCSKGGTTIEAIKIYNEMGLNDITKKAVDACIRRATELENL